MFSQPRESPQTLQKWQGKKIFFRSDGYAYAQMLFHKRLVGSEVVLVKSIAEASISPNLWMMKYARIYSDGEKRTLSSMKNTFSQRRCFQEHLGVKLWMVESFVDNIMLDFSSRVAEPEDRLIVLPRVLNAIAQRELRTLFIAYQDRDPETMQRTWARSCHQEVVNEYGVEKRIDGRDHTGWYIYDNSDKFRDLFFKYAQRIQDAFGIHCHWKWLTPERAYQISKETFLTMLCTLESRLKQRSGKRILRMERLVKETITAIEHGHSYVQDPDTGKTLVFEEQEDIDYSDISHEIWTNSLEAWAGKALSFAKGPEALRDGLLNLFRLRSECNALCPQKQEIFKNPDSLILSLLGSGITFATLDGAKELVKIMYSALYETAGAKKLRYPLEIPVESFVFTLKHVRNWFTHEHSILSKVQIECAGRCFLKHTGKHTLENTDKYDLAQFQMGILDEGRDFLQYIIDHLSNQSQ